MNIGFIGVGNMGGAIAKSLKNREDVSIVLSDHNLEKANEVAQYLEGVRILPNDELVKECEVIFLGVKPHLILSVLQAISPLAKANCLWVSMAAGVTLDQLADAISCDTASIIRIMPNMPIEIGEGMTTYTYKSKLSKDKITFFKQLMTNSGRLLYVDEEKMDAATAIAGCGPAFIFQMIEAFADAGVQEGLTREQATLLASKMIEGSAKLVQHSSKHPGQLKDQVTSPGGSTIAGIASLEKNGFRSSIIEAVHASYEKTKILKN